MEMLQPELESLFAVEAPRPLKRAEYEHLVRDGFFDDDKVELLFGMVVPMSPTDRAHAESVFRIGDTLRRQLGSRARVETQVPLAARDDSEPEPDLVVIPDRSDWTHHPTRAFLVVEVARSSLRKDRGPKALLYSLGDVDEYWIVDHVNAQVEIHRDRADGAWRNITRHARGETIAMATFPDVTIAVADILPPA